MAYKQQEKVKHHVMIDQRKCVNEKCNSYVCVVHYDVDFVVDDNERYVISFYEEIRDLVTRNVQLHRVLLNETALTLFQALHSDELASL